MCHSGAIWGGHLLSDGFCEQVADALEHLYDIVYLRNHALMSELGGWGVQTRKEQAWELHHLLIETIDALDPGMDAPSLSRAWRRHRILRLRYVEAMDIAAVCNELSISRRTFYRELKEAVRAVSELLYDRREEDSGDGSGLSAAGRLEMVRLEATRASQASRLVPLPDILRDALGILTGMAEHAGATLLVAWDTLPGDLLCDQVVLRQILLGLVDEVLGRCTVGELTVSLGRVGRTQQLLIQADDVSPVAGCDSDEPSLDVLADLARSHGMAISTVVEGVPCGCVLNLPSTSRRTILVVDDNEDTLRLIDRVLQSGGYDTVLARSGAEAESLAENLHPDAVILDVMMPGQDGWETLQNLLNRKTTAHIPVVICTVLAAKRLALSLGATAFVTKPVGEGALLAALSQILDG